MSQLGVDLKVDIKSADRPNVQTMHYVEAPMSNKRLTRRERITPTRIVLGGPVSGIARAVTTWILDQLR